MMVQKMRLAGWTFAVLCCASIFFLISAEPVPSEPVMKPELQDAPEFTLIMQDGSELSKKDVQGEPLILNFWTSWCPPCIEEMPELKTFSSEHPDIKLIGVNLTKEEFNLKNVSDFIKKHEITFPIALDESGSMQQDFRVFTIPITVIITPDGKIYETFFGPVTAIQLEKSMEALLSETNAS
ncbi:TlpA family protein disulfide reductase [Jeotgalibacillus haloalkalitolerans]|uniref:TlpA disulfide reductase family protein n=1 Tax=Jeotgalibacillus haloalkalitolerans TaxID=3104292 RepID=A0ABU5KJZ5_9BACL|nr:TlpA disulfide reductase family protein [Jeotgalibacillus sp. HH7-29]MDZ5711505.1 TlpA disulfide reductase family protein [Jeotgalibacillus sp. HH7-29]